MLEKNHEELKSLLKDGKKVLLDVYGTFCGPCKVLLPKLELIESEYPDVMFVKMDIVKNMSYAEEMGISSVPTVMIYDGEKLIDRSSGMQSDLHYKKFLNTF
jgi:thioredoxin 1